MQRTPAIIVALAQLYDHHKQELCTAISSGTFPLSDTRFKEKVSFLKEIATTLSVVVQVEKLRSKDASATEVKLPDEQVNVKDPALTKRKGPSMGQPPPNPNIDLNQFPGGWQP